METTDLKFYTNTSMRRPSGRMVVVQVNTCRFCNGTGLAGTDQACQGPLVCSCCNGTGETRIRQRSGPCRL